MLTNIITKLNDIVWGPYMLLLMTGVGLFFSIKIHFFQIVHFRTWWKLTAGSLFQNNNKKNNGISSFQAMTTALAGSIGTGNIIGVANAITLGGPGAVFWMCAASVLGMGTIFAENYLGVKYREKLKDHYSGGPMYYIEKGLGYKRLAVVFAVLCTSAAFGMGNMAQANSAAGALANGFGIPVQCSGLILALISCIIIFGGIGTISKLTEKLVPVMSFVFIFAAVFVICINIKNLPDAFSRIVVQAFNFKSAAGGAAGYGISKAVRYGISRGVFSNEAGLGSSPIAHSAAETDDPCKQGMWGFLQVFIDTIVMCTLTALCILCVNGDDIYIDGIELGTYPFTVVFGNAGKMVISISIVLFAFATLISWSYYGEKSFEYISGGKYISLYRIMYTVFVFVGSVINISVVWELADIVNGLMAVPNLFALILLSDKINYKGLREFNKKL